MQDLEGKTAFITGGASGIGLGMARAFAEAGMKVAIADIRQDHLDDAMGLFANTNFQVMPVQLDVAERAAMAVAADAVEARFGPVHLVCNNAGVNLFAPMDQCTYDDWDWVMGVNLGGVIAGVQTFVPRMKAHGQGGHIVNTASMASFITGPGAGIYTTSKFAVRGLTESLRWSLAPHGIGVSVLCPGLVKSMIYESDKVRPAHLSGAIGAVDQAFMSRLADIHQAGMEPDDVAARVLEAVRRNELYIFPHPEFKDELRELFDEILAAVPEGDVDPRRLAFEEGRRQRQAQARAAAKT
jgi:NAD(P)-dependent dehydrogenase (short-subunit alcohol dehydrogenase family)